MYMRYTQGQNEECYPGVRTKSDTYYQGWFMYMRYSIHRDRMRSTYYPGVCTKPGTYYQDWFMYMRYTQGQNEEYLLSRSVY